MATMDIFNSDAFSMVSLTDALEKTPYKPQFLGGINIFESKPQRTEAIAIEERNGALALIQTSERGAAPKQRTNEKRNIRDFRTVRIAKSDTLYAHELQNIRGFGQESELQQVQEEINRRQADLRDDMELTHEHMRLGAVQGILLDADGSVIRNWFDEFGITQPTEQNFALTTDTTDVRGKCQAIIRAMRRASKGAWLPSTQVHALCGDSFFDKLIAHDHVRDTYLSWAQAQELRDNLAFQSFPFGGIMFHNYRGTDDFDDSATSGTGIVGVKTTKAKFFPVGARGVFQVAWSPAETFDYANTPGMPVYSMLIPDEKRNAYVELEEYSYPLHICTRPGMLQRAKQA